MKVVFFLDNYLYGGDIKFFTDLIRPFIKKTKNYIICNSFDNYSNKVFKDIKKRSIFFFRKRSIILNYLIDNKENTLIKIVQKFIYLLLPLRLLFLILKFIIILKKIKPNYLISMNGGYPGSLRCLAILFAAKILNIKNFMIVASKPVPRSLKTIYDFFLDFLVKKTTNKIIVNSKNQLNLFKTLRHFSKNNLMQINNSIEINNQQFKKVNFSKKNIYLGVVTRLDQQKKIDKLIDLINLLKGNKKKFYLKIIGDGPDKKRLINLSEQLNIKERVSFLGFIENKKISKILKKLDLFVFPSEDEGLPFCILEATNNGVPVICADSGGINENFKNYRDMIILKNTSLINYYSAIKKLMNNPNLANRMRNNSFFKLNKFYDLKKNENILLEKILN